MTSVRIQIRRTFLSAVLGVSVFSSWSTSAGAETVAVYCLEGSPLLVHVISELEATGYRPVVEMSSSETAEQAATGPLWIRLAPNGSAITVHAAGREETIAVDEETSASSAALRAVELLRALRIDAGPPPEPAPNALKKEAPPRHRSPLRPVHLGFHLAPAVGYSVGGLSPALLLALGIETRWGERLALSVMGLVPTFGMIIDEAEGTATVKSGLLGASAGVHLLHRDAPVSIVAGVGAGPFFMTVEGRARGDYVSSEDSVIATLLFGAVSMAVPVLRRLSIRIGGLAGFTLPEWAIRIAGREVVSVARPIIVGLAGVEISLL